MFVVEYPRKLISSQALSAAKFILALGVVSLLVEILLLFGVLKHRIATPLELLTRGQSSVVWIKAATLREKVARLLGQPVEKMGDSQWIGHIIKRLHLLDDAGRKRGMDGMTYAVQPIEVSDMMRRYDVAVVYETR